MGDCTSSSDGTYLDVYTVNEKVGDILDMIVWPTTSALTNPLLTVVPPTGDASKTPLIFGGPAVEVAYVISSTGRWGAGVGTHDLFASGSYTLSTSCSPDDAPGEPQNCIAQNLLCGQTAGWYLTSQSCRFRNDQTHVYADFGFYGVAGDFVQLTYQSSEFTPLFGVYDSSGHQIATETMQSPTTSVIGWSVPANGMYDVILTSNESFGVGFFTLKMQCTASGCLPPVIPHQPQNVSVPYGTQAHLSANALAVGALTYDWLDMTSLPVTVGTGATFVTPAVTAPQAYSYQAKTPCGSTLSRTIVVTPQAVPHRRAARH